MQDNRKMKKWQPFMSLNEYQEEINKAIEDKKKIEKPVLSEDMMEEINQKLSEAYENQQALVFYVYQKGYIKEIVGKIVSCEFNVLIIETDGKKEKVQLNNLVNIKNV